MKEKKFFFIAGAQRCGTSYLAHILEQHPDIRIAQPFFPEPKFFLKKQEYFKGREYYLSQYFAEAPSEKLLGEKSTSYIESREAAINIKGMFPKAKIVFSLRNPVERALSNYFFTKANNLEPRSLEEVFLENKPIYFDPEQFSVSPYDYLERGRYIKYIKVYEEVFGKKSLHIAIFEKLVKEKEEWEKLFNFLEVLPTFPEHMNKKVHEGIIKEKPNPKVVEAITNYYQASTKELANYLGQDLSFWNL